MQKKIVNQSYSYIPGGMASLSATFQLLADDGVTVLTEKGLSCSYELDKPDFQEQVASAFARQAQEHVDQFVVVAGMVFGNFPTCQTFDEALAIITTDALGRITVGGV